MYLYTFPLSCGETAAFYRRVLRSTVPFLLFLICDHFPPDFFLNPIVRMKHICACRCHTGDPAGCASCKPSERKKTKKNKNSGRFTKKTNKNKIKPGSDGDQAQSLYEVSYYFGSGAWQKKMAGGDVNFVERAAAFCGLTTSDTGICVNCHGKFVRKLDPHLKLQYSHLTKMPSPGNELPLTPASHKVTPSNLNCTTTQGGGCCETFANLQH